MDNSIKTMTSGAAILNHSIKNEIAKISLCASGLNAVGLKPAQMVESAQIMLRSTDHILKMIERTSQCTRDFTLEKTSINLKDFMEEILKEFQYQFLEKKIEVTTNFSLGGWITVDKLHLREVINNVIENAVRRWNPAELLPHIFEPFFTTKNPKRNFGLGLLYCYKFLKKHGGRIEIESEPNKGTTLYLNLPRYTINGFCMAKGASYVQNKSISG